MAGLNTLSKLGTVVETDILIIGGGPSGLWAAVKAKPHIDKVIVVDKGPIVGPTSAGYFAGGGLVVVKPNEDIDKFVEEMVYFEDGLVEQDLLEAFARQSYQRIIDLENVGCNFFRDEKGELFGHPQRGLKHVWHYTQKPFGTGGKRMLNGLANEAKRLGVQLMSRIFITDVLKTDGKVNGAVGFDMRTGEYFIFKAKAVIICTGSGNIQSHYQDMGMSTGDGIRMAYESGCEMKNLEFATFWVVPRLFGWAGITNILPLGAKFVNAKNEEFIDKFSPVLKSNCDFNYLSMFFALQHREGKTPILLDCSPMKPEAKESMKPGGGWTKLQYQKLLDMGIKFFEQKTEWMPGFHGTMGGVVKTNLKMETNVPGLYIGGRLRSTDPGLYIGGWALATCAAYGTWAGENAADYAAGIKSTPVSEDKVAEIKHSTFAHLVTNGVNPEDVVKKLQEAVFPYDVILLRNEKKMQQALNQVIDIRDNLVPQMGATDLHYLKKLLEVRNMTLTAELILRAALLRKETRAAQYREDYPLRDDKNWLKWIVFRKEGNGMDISMEPVPFEKYKFKPTSFYSDNFRLPGGKNSSK